jgi:hypothetical protein
MQHNFWKDAHLRSQFVQSLSQPRFARYLSEAGHDPSRALKLYEWNPHLSREFYLYLQAWEICLRNQLNDFLIHRYGRSWPYDTAGLVRQLSGTDEERLSRARQRQERIRRAAPAALPAIVSDLSLSGMTSPMSGGGTSRRSSPTTGSSTVRRRGRSATRCCPCATGSPITSRSSICRSSSVTAISSASSPRCAQARMPSRSLPAASGRYGRPGPEGRESPQNTCRSAQYSPPARVIAAGRVRIQASARLRTVAICRPVPLAHIVPATPLDRMWVVETGRP